MHSLTKKTLPGVNAYINFLIYVCLCTYLLVDSVNGFLLKSGGASISIVFKMFLAFLMVLYLLSKIDVVFFINTILLIISVRLLIYPALNDFFPTLMNMKILLNFVCFFYFFYFLKSCKQLNYRSYNRFFTINIIVFLVNIALGIAGFGFQTYAGAEFGVKGFFYAGNEVAVLFFCLYYFVLIEMKKRSKKILLIYIAALAVSLLIATKVAILSCIFISGVDFYFRFVKRSKLSVKMIYLFILSVIISLGIYFIPQTPTFQIIMERMLWFSQTKSSIADAITSGRITFFQNNYKVWEYFLSPTVFLFGLSKHELPKLVEIDLFDVLFLNGAIFLVIVLLFYCSLFVYSIKIRNYRLFYFNLCYFGISLIAGHVWYSVMSGVFFAYINAYELVSHKRNNENRRILCQTEIK